MCCIFAVPIECLNFLQGSARRMSKEGAYRVICNDFAISLASEIVKI